MLDPEESKLTNLTLLVSKVSAPKLLNPKSSTMNYSALHPNV